MRDLAVAVVLAMAIHRADSDDALIVPFASPVRSARGVSAPAVAENAVPGPPPDPPAGQGARLDRHHWVKATRIHRKYTAPGEDTDCLVPMADAITGPCSGSRQSVTTAGTVRDEHPAVGRRLLLAGR